MSTKTPAQRHGKQECMRRLIEAVGALLARDGFRGLGVNKVAKQAGVDKVLIYRYFGGLPELVSAFSQTPAFWPSADELIGGDEEAIRALGPEAQLAFFFKSFLRGLRRRPMTQMIMVWWSSEPDNPLARELEDIRMRSALETLERLDKIPTDQDLTAVVAFFYAAISRLVELSYTTGFLAGIDLSCDSGWQRIEQAIDMLTHGIFTCNEHDERR